MAKPLILVSCSSGVSHTGTPMLYCYTNYLRAIEREGALALLVSDGDPDAASRLAGMADGLLLTGGVDLAPSRYGEEALPVCGTVDRVRDAAEDALFRAFFDAGKPVLGICRGMQVINAFLGGTLWQDVPGQIGIPHPGDGVMHPVTTAAGSRMAEHFGASFEVNSYHHQAVKALAPDLIATCTAPGELVESFVHTGRPITGVQWHPERMCGKERTTPEGPDMSPLFRDFVDACR